MLENHLSRSDNIFRAALFLSVLVHLVVITYLKLPQLIEPMRGKMVLSVILMEPKDVGQPAPELPSPVVVPVTQLPPEAPRLLPQEPSAKPEQTSPPMEIVEPIPELESEPAPGETLHEKPADPVESNQEIVEAGKVQALLVVDASGAVRQIIWKMLPALTDEALQRIEQQLRGKTYLATGKAYTLHEIVEIPRE